MLLAQSKQSFTLGAVGTFGGPVERYNYPAHAGDDIIHYD